MASGSGERHDDAPLDIRGVPDIAEFVRKNYHENTVHIIVEYRELLETSGSVAASEPSYKVYEVINAEVRNAMDHLGRASDQSSTRTVAHHIEMADWHLDQAKIAALIPMVADQADILAE